MSITQSIVQHFKRYRSLQTHQISSLPIVILMPHSACNCRCVMCDIWKDNKNLKQLNEEDIRGLLDSLNKLGTQQVLMTGGEALLNPNFFTFCRILKKQGIRISLLSTGLTLKKNAEQLINHVNDIIVSLDGDAVTHDQIRNIPGAFESLKEGVHFLKNIEERFPISARTVIHRLNFRHWHSIIESAREIGLDRISFLAADVSSHAFNREVLWSDQRKEEIMPGKNELDELNELTEKIIHDHAADIRNGFIAESADKLRMIGAYYAALHGLNSFPNKKCNAPWVSAVVEADGTLRPCFFHEAIGNIREGSLEQLLNSEDAIRFRKELDTDRHPNCEKCVCYLNLSPGTKLN